MYCKCLLHFQKCYNNFYGIIIYFLCVNSLHLSPSYIMEADIFFRAFIFFHFRKRRKNSPEAFVYPFSLHPLMCRVSLLTSQKKMKLISSTNYNFFSLLGSSLRSSKKKTQTSSTRTPKEGRQGQHDYFALKTTL